MCDRYTGAERSTIPVPRQCRITPCARPARRLGPADPRAGRSARLQPPAPSVPCSSGGSRSRPRRSSPGSRPTASSRCRT
ncbi:MAG: hypothetical protein E6H86_08750 [Chloroflexi bacterium]|nr:MAG: hypothetical protein E6H86_08750 [Chloroflexota bacterium]